MQSLPLRSDTLIEIATFLVRRWSEKENVTIEFSKKREISIRIKENRVILIPLEHYLGSDFDKYRQSRT